MKRIKEINARLRDIARQERSGLSSFHDLMRLEKEKEELEKELQILIKTNKWPVISFQYLLSVQR